MRHITFLVLVIIAKFSFTLCLLQAQETNLKFTSRHIWGVLEIKSGQCPVTLVFNPFEGIESNSDAIISLYENESLLGNERNYCDINLNPLVDCVVRTQSDGPDLQPEIEWASQKVLSETLSYNELPHIKSYKPFHKFLLFLQEHRGKVYDLVTELNLCQNHAEWIRRFFVPHFLQICAAADEKNISLDYQQLPQALKNSHDQGYYNYRSFAAFLCVYGYASTISISGVPMIWTNQMPSPSMPLEIDPEGNATFLYNGPQRHLTCTPEQSRADVLARRREYQSLQADSKSPL